MLSIFGSALLVLLASWWSTASAMGAVQPASISHDTVAYPYDTVGYTYDVPALLSTQSATQTYARGSPSGPGATSWETSVSVAGDVVAANTFTRSLDDVTTLRGATTAEIEGLIPSGWVKSATNANKGGLGTRYANPERLGEQIRIMPGKITDPNPLKQGPYLRISRDGTVTDPIPLFGNPTL